MRNQLFINRLVIYTINGKIAYDENYHHGVNIIRGDNSSGKSTIAHFIFYVLGGAFNKWVKEAKKCNHVFAEIEINGKTIVLKRNLEEHTKAAIYFYYGTYEAYLADMKNAEWKKYGYDKTRERKSFSNLLFDELDFPIVYGDSNITMHQILRLLYVDQDSPTNSLFLYEQFDSQLTRETVSDLLLGIYNEELYLNKIQIRKSKAELENVNNEIKGIKKFIDNPLNLIPAKIIAKIEKSEQDLLRINVDITKLKENQTKVTYSKRTKLEFQKLTEKAIDAREALVNLEEQERLIIYELEDTTYFIESQRNKLNAIKNSISTREFLGEFQLDHCPECLSPLENQVSFTHCKLCKKEIDETTGITQARKIAQEIEFQIKESEKILTYRKKEKENTSINISSQKLLISNIQKEVNNALKDVKSYRSEKIDSLYTEKGFVEGEMLQFRTFLENAESYQILVVKQKDLENGIGLLGESIKRNEVKQESLKINIKKQLKDEGLELLRNDLYRQREFRTAKSFNIDFRNNLAFLDDKELRFSASSDFYLKTTARFALFFASLKIDSMRYPRFIICDNMEDKGIEAKRAENFQKLIIGKANEYKKENFQIIYTTSFITEQLNSSPYTVGEYYTEANPSLKEIKTLAT